MARRRNPATAISLFAFQDIITAVTGIVVLITLLLSIELLDRTKSTTAEDETQSLNRQTQETIVELETEIACLTSVFERESKIVVDLPTDDLVAIREMVGESDDQIEKLSQSIARKEVELSEKLESFGLLEHEIASNRDAKIQELEQNRQETIALEKTVEELKKGGRRFFKTGDSKKTTWLVEIADGGFRIAPIGRTQRPKSIKTPRDFVAWTKTLDSKIENLFILVKPNGETFFKEVLEDLFSNQIEFGFSCVGVSDFILDDERGAGI
ncbi:MAG TPA: hypothetical protein PKD64_11780 [Pirellulaceae bacterium]|nr:hypothetical protein [Pirellulaceae bacterium]HMO92864.1 hypothetical protein [Pirellulaceae bacterium]HMP71103.1 hypothetical protein [Pirellulaceae bacterium]